MHNAKQSININSPMVNAVRAVVGQKSDLKGPNNRTKEARICRLGRGRDHRSDLPFLNCAQSFTRPLYRRTERGVIAGKYGSSSMSPSSGPRSR